MRLLVSGIATRTAHISLCVEELCTPACVKNGHLVLHVSVSNLTDIGADQLVITQDTWESGKICALYMYCYSSSKLPELLKLDTEISTKHMLLKARWFRHVNLMK